MPALNFQAQFAQAVEDGAKRQTIRAFRKDKRDPKVGQTLYLYTGMRTKACRKLGEAECIDVVPLDLGPFGVQLDTAEGATLLRVPCPALTRFAQDDGFASWPEMAAWFDKVHGLPFRGLLIRWGDVVAPEASGE